MACDNTPGGQEHTPGPRRSLRRPFRDHGLIRLAVGLAAADDPGADLDEP